MPIRQHLILRYAESILADPSLWRIAVIYMCGCGERGKLYADEVLRRVPLELGRSKGKGKAVAQNDAMDTDEENPIDEKVREVLEICKEYEREGVRREICQVPSPCLDQTFKINFDTIQIAARTFVDMGNYHLAISYYTSAEDWAGVARVADLMLAKSITEGMRLTRTSVIGP